MFVCVCKDWKKLITECSYQYRAWRRPLKPIRERIGTDLILSSELPLLALLLLCGHGDVQICEWFVHQYPIGTKEKTKLMDCLQAAYYQRHYAVCRWLDANFQLSDYVSAETYDIKICYASNQALLRSLQNCSEPMLPNLNTNELLDNFRSLFPADRILYNQEDFIHKRAQLKFLMRLSDVAFYEEYESCLSGYCDDEWKNVIHFLVTMCYGNNEEIFERFLTLILKKYESQLWRLRNTLRILQTHKEYEICITLLHNVKYFRNNNHLCSHLVAMRNDSSLRCKHALVEDHVVNCTEISIHMYCKAFMNILDREENTVEHVRWFYELYGSLLQKSSKCYYRWMGSGNYREPSKNEGGRYHCVDMFFLISYQRASTEVVAFIHEHFPIPEHCIDILLHEALLFGQKQAVRLLLPQVRAAGVLNEPRIFERATRSVKSNMLHWLLLELGEEHALCIPTKDLCISLCHIRDPVLWNQTLHLLKQQGDFQENIMHLLASLVDLSHGTHYRNYVALLSFVKENVDLTESLWQKIIRPLYQFSKSTIPSGTTSECCRDMIQWPTEYLYITLHHTIIDLYKQYSVNQDTPYCESYVCF